MIQKILMTVIIILMSVTLGFFINSSDKDDKLHKTRFGISGLFLAIYAASLYLIEKYI